MTQRIDTQDAPALSEQSELEVLRAAIKLGADEADAGLFSTRNVEEIIAEGIARARRRDNG
ncbi:MULTISPECIES: hypothetical protein [Nitrospirillum]|uniref:Antitoxin ParD1/3/4 n=1 Tax=Nitrospirillum amazonense TaxID=28077 RepID=A0A560FQC9_9PROT|nr:hypothetical protein [Nitrospirillum amazonense]MEC4592970.1 hypothetical protein [Nitrospirillum amazonense]TWB23835.1 hypothetical protein FBZ88_1135 [Nitrospirillum amazonense]